MDAPRRTVLALALCWPLLTAAQPLGMSRVGAHPDHDLNTATRAEIEAVRGVGVELAERVLRARSLGRFEDWADLRRRVKGVNRRALVGWAEAGFHIAGQPPPV